MEMVLFGAVRVGLLLFLVTLVEVVFASENVADQSASRGHHVPPTRQRREWMAREACMMSFTVPRQSIACDPSPELAGALGELQDAMEAQDRRLANLSKTLEALDPDSPRDLPAEVRERLDTILAVRIAQVRHTEALQRLDAEIRHLAEKVQSIESSDRQELAHLIHLQSNLIKVTLHQSNVSLHDEYIDQLSESTNDLKIKLQQLELNLRKSIRDAETKLERTVKQSESSSQSELSRVRDRVAHMLTSFEEKLFNDSLTMLHYQNKTDGNKAALLKFLLTLGSLQERQAIFQRNEETMRDKLDHLDKQLQEERVEKEAMVSKSEMLQNTLTKMEGLYTDLVKELRDCMNRTTGLTDKYDRLETAMRERDHLIPQTLKVSDCQEALRFYQPVSGVYAVSPGLTSKPGQVYCQMDGTIGWTVLLRRQDGAQDFYRGWQAYKEGFGDLQDEHWIGLQTIYVMTNQKKYRLRIDIQDWNDKWWHAQYSQFHLENEANNYKLHISGYSGDAGDSLEYHNGMEFSAHDRANDLSDGICPRWCHGAWWYRDCFSSNLNGRYYKTGGEYRTKTGWGDGVVWRELKQTNFYSVKSAIMKITPL